MRSLVLATAGHVNHGKSSLLLRLTGCDPDRLPQEKARAMTLDLGFVHNADVSFVDVPGHERLVRHTIAAHSAVDGALFVVAFNEGLQEQSFEHARILNWLKVSKVLIVITKGDLAKDDIELAERGAKLVKQTRALFSPPIQVDHLFSSPSEQDTQNILSKIKTYFSPTTTLEPANSRRFFIDRSFTLKGIGTVVTGTFSEGTLQKGDKPTLWFANGKKPREVTIKSLRRHETPVEQIKDFGRVAFVLDHVRPQEITRGSCLLWGQEDFISASNLALNLQWAVAPKKQTAALIQVGTISHEAQLRLHPTGYWRCTPKLPLPLRRGDRLLVRVPQRIKGVGHTVAGGSVLEINLPSRKTKKTMPQKEAARAPSPEKPLNQNLLHALHESRWQAYITDDQTQDAHRLVKAGLAHRLKDNHFLHHELFEELLRWMNFHFEHREILTIEDARGFFKTGRKNFLDILEFCDRAHWTFRKDTVRKKFKLPSCSRPWIVPPSNERADETPSAPLHGSC